jgi:molybdenum cofactor cytidylyltransferase
MRFGIVILAAGSSSRMGEPKQLLPLNGAPLLLNTVQSALASAAWPVVVVLGAHAEKIRPLLSRHPVLIAENPAWAEGMASSLRTGVSVLQQFSRSIEAVVVALCDQPAFSADTVSRLISAQKDSGRSMIAARYNGRNGAPALFLRRHFGQLVSLTGEEGARAVLNASAADVGIVDLPELATDLDTRAEYDAHVKQNS